MSVNKSTDLEEALEAYRKHFGFNYPMGFGRIPNSEVDMVEKILDHIERNEPAPEPVYKDGCDY